MTDGIAPQWVMNGAASSTQAVMIIMAVIVVAVMAWWAAWRERATAGAAVVWGSFALRCTALVVLGVLLFQPAWAWTVTTRQLGRIVIAVDASDSMQATDPQASAHELLQWGIGLGWLDRQVAAQQLADENPPRDAALAARFATLHRTDVATRIVTDPHVGLLTELSKLGDLDLQVFAGESRATSGEELPALLSAPASGLQTHTTQTTAALRAAMTSPSQKTLGVVLLTDGRDAAPATALTMAKNLGAANVPIYPVLIGSVQRPRDIVILSVDAPLAAYRGDQSQVVVTFSAHGYESISITIALHEIGRTESTQSQAVEVTGAAQSVSLTVAPEDIGRHRYQVTIAPRPDETRTDNNEREFTLQLVDDRTHVLLAESEPRWEFRYLETALSRDEHVDLETVLFWQPFLQRLDAPFFSQSWPKNDSDAAGADFDALDLLILGDLDGRQAPPAIWSEIEKFVAEQGGTLVLIAGRDQARKVDITPGLAKLLPITQPRLQFPVMTGTEAAGLQGWMWQLTSEGERQTFLQFATDAEANRAIWSVLPGATWGLIGEPKPGATVWAHGQLPSGAATDRTTTIPLLVHHHYGLGQVIWLATDSTWRWRFRAGDQFHHRFWGQLTRWAATTKLSAGNEFVQFGALRPTYAVGETVTLQARWSAGFARQNPDRKPHVKLRRGNELVDQRELLADVKRPLISLTEWPDLSPGEYRARLLIEGVTPPPAAVEAEFTITAPQGIETADVTADAAFLESLAQASGGRVFRLDQLHELPAVFPAFAAVSTLPEERPVWDRWPMLVLLVTLLSGEWWLRRRSGLA